MIVAPDSHPCDEITGSWRYYVERAHLLEQGRTMDAKAHQIAEHSVYGKLRASSAGMIVTDNDPCDEWEDWSAWFMLWIGKLIPNIMNGVLMQRPIMPGKSMFASGGPINMHSRVSFIMGNAGPEMILPRCHKGK